MSIACWPVGVPADDRTVAALNNAPQMVTFRLGETALTPHSVLTTSNPARGTGQEGSMFLWLHHGRPAVAVAIYEWDGMIVHETDALARSGRLTGQSVTGRQWVPENAALRFRVLPGAPPPSDTTSRRQLQAKEQARLFSVLMLGFNNDNSDREQLRLLPTPIYQYQFDAAHAANENLIDGAVFAFVQGTDPEALLIIEAIQEGQHRHWEYAIVRATAGALEGRLRGEVVFTAEKFPPDSDVRKPHFSFRHTIEEAVKR